MKKMKKIVVAMVIFSMMTIYGGLTPQAQAVDSLTDAKDLISDSDVGVTATHIFTFTSGTSTLQNGYFDVVFPADFGDISVIGDVSCPANYTETIQDTETVRCTAGSLQAAGAREITVANIVNPAAEGSQLFNIYHYDSATNLAERTQVMVAIIEDVLMTARVDATLTFTIAGLDNTETVNGVACTDNTSATSTPFGTLSTTGSTTVCQELTVATNATDGYTVTVEQDNELLSSNGDNINSFNNSPDNTGSTTPQVWAAPANILDAEHTYGHMGLTSEDATFAGAVDTYGDALYVGFNSTDPVEVMYHDGPADGVTPNKGLTQVAYTAEITALQEAGDYENTLTYIATPTY